MIFTDAAQTFAFTVYLNDHTTVEKGSTVKFDGIISNVGNHYNPVTGHFTCPQTGVYAFSLNIMSHNFKQAYVHLVKEGQTINLALANNPWEKGLHIHSASFAALQCQTALRMWVEGYQIQSVIYGHKFSTFSGHFLGK